MTCRPTGELRSSRFRRKATISASTPAAVAWGARVVSQMCRIVRRMTSGLLPSRLAISRARSAAAVPVRRPGPELMNVSDPMPEAPARTASRTTRPAKEWPATCTSPRPAPPGAAAAARAATASMTAAMSKPSSAIV